MRADVGVTPDRLSDIKLEFALSPIHAQDLSMSVFVIVDDADPGIHYSPASLANGSSFRPSKEVNGWFVGGKDGTCYYRQFIDEVHAFTCISGPKGTPKSFKKLSPALVWRRPR